MPAGRPTKYEPARVKKILKGVRAGNSVRNSARLGGIALSTLYEWLDQYPEFSEQFEEATAQAENVYVEDIGHMSRRGNLAATKYWLACRSPEDWKEPKDDPQDAANNPGRLYVVEKVTFGGEHPQQ